MTDWPAHPDDEWVEVTSFGDTEPRYMQGQSGAAHEVAIAKEQYVSDKITIEEFEAVLDRVLIPQVRDSQ